MCQFFSSAIREDALGGAASAENAGKQAPRTNTANTRSLDPLIWYALKCSRQTHSRGAKIVKSLELIRFNRKDEFQQQGILQTPHLRGTPAAKSTSLPRPTLSPSLQ